MLTIGYIGNGKSVNRYHLPFSLSRNEKIKVKTIYTKDLEKDTWQRVKGIKYIDNLDELLNDSEIQLVVVCTTNDFHYEYAKKILDSGKNVLVEKPFVYTKKEAEFLFNYARERGLFIQCYQNRRFDSDFLTTQKVIESGKLGEILEVELNFDYYRPDMPEGSNKSIPGNSFLYGHGCHTVDQIISYFGKPDSVHYDVRQLLGENHMNDYFDLDFYYSSLKVSIRSSFYRLKSRPSFVVYGKKGMFVKETRDRQEEHLKYFYTLDNSDFGIDLPEHYGAITYLDNDGVYHEEKVVSEKGDYARIYDHVYESIINGAPKVVTDEETIMQIDILEKGFNKLI